jgi:hypothetical protein
MSLEAEIKKVMEEPLEASAPMLEATTAEKDPNTPISPDEQLTLIYASIAGLKRGVLRLAREIDQQRNV